MQSLRVLVLLALLVHGSPRCWAQMDDWQAEDWLSDQGAHLLENYEKIIVTTSGVKGVGGIGISLPFLGPVSGVKTFGLVLNDGAVYESGLLYTQAAVLRVNGRNIVVIGRSWSAIVNGILQL